MSLKVYPALFYTIHFCVIFLLESFGWEPCHFDQTILLKVSIQFWAFQFMQGVGEKDPMTFCILDLWRGLLLSQALESARVNAACHAWFTYGRSVEYIILLFAHTVLVTETAKSSQQSSSCQRRRYRPSFLQASKTVQIRPLTRFLQLSWAGRLFAASLQPSTSMLLWDCLLLIWAWSFSNIKSALDIHICFSKICICL